MCGAWLYPRPSTRPDAGCCSPMNHSSRRITGQAADSPYSRPHVGAAGRLIHDDGSRSNVRTLDSTHAEVLDLQIVLDAVFGALTAVAALLDPAERRNLGRDQSFIDADY